MRLTRVQYTQGKPGSDFTEISIDCGYQRRLSADYAVHQQPERDQTFFIIRSMALTGQQGGLVNLAAARLHVAAPGGCAPADCLHSRAAIDPRHGCRSAGGRVAWPSNLGIENKRQVYIVIVLFAIILGCRRR